MRRLVLVSAYLASFAHALAAVPVASPDSYSLSANTTLNQGAPGVMANDTPNGGVAVLVGSPSHAAAFSLNQNGSFSYTPTLGFAGTDQFTYRIQNGDGPSATVAATLNVFPVLTSFLLDPTSVVGGFAVKATATLNVAAPTGGSLVTLSTDSPTRIDLPASINVRAGTLHRGIRFGTKTVTTQTALTVSATYRGVTLNASLTLRIGGLQSLQVSPNPLPNGGSSTGTVKISGPAPTAGRTIQLKSASGEITFPATVFIAKNLTEATFQVSANVAAFTGPVVLTAKLGTTTRSVTLTLAPPSADVDMSANLFTPKTLKVPAGTTVRWTNNDPMGHTVTPDVPGFGPDSSTDFPGSIPFESTYSWQVPANAAVGTKYFYYCVFHGSPGNGTTFGTGMAGVVEVIAG